MRYVFTACANETICVLLAAALSGMAVPSPASAQETDRLISEQEAQRYGLHRAWYSQVRVDPARGRVAQLTLDKDLLVVLTDQAIVHAMDADTGATRWVTQFGNPNFASLGPASNDQYVAVVNGSTLYLIDRITGTVTGEQPLGGGPGGGPALSGAYVFAPLISGVVKGFSLEDFNLSGADWAYPCVGRPLTQPGVSDESVFWPTDRGFLYVAMLPKPQMRFRLETQDEIIATPGYRKPFIFVGSLDGYVYAVHETTGVQAWKHSVGDDIPVSPAAIEDQVFVCSQAPRMHCLAAVDGEELWQAGHVERFVAASPERVYGMDRWSNLYILDRASGAQRGRISFRGSTMPLVNQQTDRLYLASPLGLVQCLHEIGIDEPIRYIAPPLPENLDDAAAPGAATPQTAPATQPEAAVDDPFGAGAAEENPFNP